MKRLSGLLIAVVLSCLLSSPALARDEVLIRGPLDYGGYGGLELKAAPMRKETGLFVGGYGGWFINHTFFIGAGGYGLVNKVKAPVTGLDGETLYYEMGYGGLILEYVNNSNKIAHFTMKTLIGGGGLGYEYKRSFGDWASNYSNESFFIVEPDINLELNVFTHFRVALGVGYRYIDGIESEGLTGKDLSGVYANLTLKFGGF
ncbi:MAG: hypothetical protein GX081_04920 [Firmicutes bacterium]|nr:hypothetical protein [Bacillota bacterium]